MYKSLIYINIHRILQEKKKFWFEQYFDLVESKDKTIKKATSFNKMTINLKKKNTI